MTPVAYRNARRLEELCRDYLRAPHVMSWNVDHFDAVFEPPLSSEEQAVYAALITMSQGGTSISREDLDAIRPNLQALRDFRQLGRNAFMALTAADRDRALYDAQTDTTIILLALLRS